MRLVTFIGPVGVAILAGCGHGAGRDAKPLTPRARGDSEMIDVSSMMATVRGANSATPPCPVNAHAEASMVLQGVSGPVQYRWERSDGTNGPLAQLNAPPAPAAGKPALVNLQPDNWTDNQRGVQLTIDEIIHVTYPFDFRSAPVTLNIKCY
ncbi:MAG TPA: hypothetical protein VGL65_03850 [Gemmatimonadales bacterium]